MEISVTKHACERYCERILEKNITYAQTNRDEVVKDIIELFGKSEWLYKGKFQSNEIGNFYIDDNIIFVLNEQNQAIITLYTISYGFGEIDKQITEGLVDKIKDIQNVIAEESEQYEVKIQESKLVIMEIDEKINLLQQEINMLEVDKKTKLQEIKSYENECSKTKKSLFELVSKIIYSVNYKMETLSKKY